jgi:hypothetical protein
VRALGFPEETYVIFGSAPMLARGLIDKVGDVDLLAVGAAWDKATQLAPPQAAPHGDLVVKVRPDLEVFSSWMGQDVAAILSRAELVDGLPLAHLSDVIAYKQLLGRPKDRAHIALIETYLAQGDL